MNRQWLAGRCDIVKYHDMDREKFIAKLTEIQQSAGQLLAQLEASGKVAKFRPKPLRLLVF